MKRRRKAGLAIVIFLVAAAVIVAATLFVLGQPVEPEGQITPSEANSRVFAGLAQEGIDGAVVDVTQERAFVRYEVPENSSVEESELLVTRVVAAEAPNASSVVLEVYRDFEPVEEVTVSMETAERFGDDEISAEELRGSWDVESLS